MNLLGAGFAVIFLGYFLWKSLKMRIYLLGLPFLMYMGESVFFDRVKVFWMPQRLGPSVMIMVWLLIVWVVSMDLLLPRGEVRRPRRLFGPPLRLPEELILGALLVAILAQIVLSSIHYGDALVALGQGAGWLFLVVGYLFVRGIVAMAPPSDVVKFLYSLVVVNAIAAVFYIANQALHVPLYSGGVSGVDVYHGQIILRSFAYYPQLLLLTLAVLFAKPRWTWMDPLILLVNVIAIWLSYARSWLLVALVVLGAVLLVRVVKARQAHLVMRRLASILALLVVVAAVLAIAFPTQSGYFLSRVGAATGPGGISRESSFAARQSFVVATYRHVREVDALLGVGFAGPGQDARFGAVERWSADTLWVPVVYRLGLVGVVLFAAVFAAYIARAAVTALRSAEEYEYLSLVWLGVLAGTAMGTFVSWSVVNPNRLPLGLWPFAFLAALPLVPRGARPDEEGEE